ncbi:hypothetical protein NM208_g7169 [Fusarium decemcellulare]|uniref:Uncharacterized protein n=1 Tax=Fusarium decemcellulare TaxID=57161 RepID=A0ACC1SAE3_9HYPO|nr:hypothetical protein NM208_g7169 [Fusarium decemcellulare]
MATEKRAGDRDLQIESTDQGLDHLKDVDLHDKVLANDALEATAQEHSFGVIQGFKTYKRAAFWSIRKSLAQRSQTAALTLPSHLDDCHHGGLRCHPLELLLRIPTIQRKVRRVARRG